jgi:hypothetical protein
LEGFLPGLEKITFTERELEKCIPVDQVRADPTSKESFPLHLTKKRAVIRVLDDFDSKRTKIATKDANSKLYREASLKERISSTEANELIIFGVATDGFIYHFWRVDHQSNVSENLSFFLKMSLNSEGFQ